MHFIYAHTYYANLAEDSFDIKWNYSENKVMWPALAGVRTQISWVTVHATNYWTTKTHIYMHNYTIICIFKYNYSLYTYMQYNDIIMLYNCMIQT